MTVSQLTSPLQYNNTSVNVEIDQITKVLTICGTPTNETLSKITSEEAILYIRSLPTMEKKDFQTVFPGANPQGETTSYHQLKTLN